MLSWIHQYWDDVRSIYSRDPAARSILEIVFLYPGLHAVWIHYGIHYLWTLKFIFVARMLSFLVRGCTGIEIHPNARIGKRCFIDHGMGVVIGETTIIGDDCTIYQGVTLGGCSLEKGKKRHPTIGNRVMLGAGCKILGDIVIHDDCIIGSNVVVKKSLEKGSVYIGNKTTTKK